VFERFTDEARQVVVLAQEEARTLRHSYIGTEHILLGLAREPNTVASRALSSVGLPIERVRAEVARRVGVGNEVTEGQVPFTPRAKKVLELSLREALSLGDDGIGADHILLGLLRERDGVGSEILVAASGDAETIRGEVMRIRAGAGEPWRARSGGPLGPAEVRMLAGLIPVLRRLSHEISTELGRRPDAGDLLIVLACARDTVAGRALAALEVDPDALWATVERLRSEDEGVRSGLEHQVDEARQVKEQAIESKEFDRAAQARDQERELSMRLREQDRIGPETLQEIRRRLGLPEPPRADV
jgi:ATP-dependent Clp protease ATP-binding subunit ClpA